MPYRGSPPNQGSSGHKPGPTTGVRNKNKKQEAVKIVKPYEIMEAIHIRINCPLCGTLHIDKGEFAVTPHKTHTCQVCGLN